MIYPELAERLVQEARKNDNMAVRLLRATGHQTPEMYLAASPAEKAAGLDNLLGELLIDRYEHRILEEIEGWESENIARLDISGLSDVGAKALEDRRFVRGLINTLKYSPVALAELVQQYPFHRGIFEAALSGDRRVIPRLQELVIEKIGRSQLSNQLSQNQGYDLEADVSKYQPYDAVGEVLDLPADQKEFKKAMQERRHWVYNKFTVTPTEVDGSPHWLVFFA